MAKIKSNNFRETNGYTRVGSIFKSGAEKQELQKRQARINSFTPGQNKQVAATLERNDNVNEAVKNGAVLNSGGAEPGYQGDQRFKAKRKVKIIPKFLSK